MCNPQRFVDKIADQSEHCQHLNSRAVDKENEPPGCKEAPGGFYNNQKMKAERDKFPLTMECVCCVMDELRYKTIRFAQVFTFVDTYR